MLRRPTPVLIVMALLAFVASCAGATEPPASTTATTTIATPTTTIATPTTTIATPTTTTTTVPAPFGLEPAVPGHNELAADRINLVFAPWGWDDPEAFRRFVDAVVGWSGEVTGFGADGDPTSDGDATVSGDLGVFGFEPFRSNRHRFNVWVTDVEPPEPAGWLNTDDVPFDLPDLSIITLAWEAETEVPGITSVSGIDTQFYEPEPLRRLDADPFANVMVNVEPWRQVEALWLTVHELGHALFGLTDEYVGRIGGDGVPRADTWPSCAQSRETAEAWWSDDVGEYDPMVDVWISEMEAAGLGETIDPGFLRDENRTDYVAGGCFGETATYRSAEDTLMGLGSPAFGITNRRWAEQILDLWEGT